jgi:hypothetical protein
MTRYLTRDRAAIAAAVIAPLGASAILLPFRAGWPNTNVALLLVVAVAAIGNRVAGAIAAIGAAVWFDFFFTLPYARFTIRSSADVTTFVLLLVVAGRGRWDVETVGLPGGEVELRVFANGQYYGRFMMRPKPGSRPSLQARLVAVTLAELAGRALAGAPTASTR